MQVQLQLPSMLFAEAPQDFQHHQSPLSGAIHDLHHIQPKHRPRHGKGRKMADLPSTPMLKLPNELLDQIFSYLDWDRSKDLYPTKPDIINGSLTCRKLREALKPLVFRDVTLRLRWVRGQLIEPCLYRLRREYPELARHIRCVYIR